MLQMVRTLSTPEPLPDAMLQSHTDGNPTSIQSVLSLGAWNVNEAPPHMDTPPSFTPELKVPTGAPAEAKLKVGLKILSLPSEQITPYHLQSGQKRLVRPKTTKEWQCWWRWS